MRKNALDQTMLRKTYIDLFKRAMIWRAEERSEVIERMMEYEKQSQRQIDSLNHSFEEKLRTLKEHESSISKLHSKWSRDSQCTNQELVEFLTAKNENTLNKKKANIGHKRDKELFRRFEAHYKMREDLLGRYQGNRMKNTRPTRSHSAPRLCEHIFN